MHLNSQPIGARPDIAIHLALRETGLVPELAEMPLKALAILLALRAAIICC